jgi:hypothetical protein
VVHERIPVMKLQSLAAIAIVVAFVGVFAANQLSHKSAAVAPPLHPEQVKAQARQIAYDALAREPGRYAGAFVVFEGKVVQTLYTGSDVLLRVEVTKGKYDLWKDVVWVDYQRKSGSEPRILDGDIVRFWGKYVGIYSYKSVMGATIQVPRVIQSVVEPASRDANARNN